MSPDLVEQVTRKINANAQAFTVAPGNCHITEFHTNTIACTFLLPRALVVSCLPRLFISFIVRPMCSANSPIEDRHNQLLHDPQIYDGSLFGMYDGHGGWAGMFPRTLQREAVSNSDLHTHTQHPSL